MTVLEPIDPKFLPDGIRSRFVEDVAGLRMHLLEAGHETPNRPCLLLLHGFPELAYSWRKVMPQLAAAGYHVIAPDQRGYGRTTGWSADYDGELRPFNLLNLVCDALALLQSLGIPHVDAVVGHDFGSSVAAWCALTRPDVFRAVTLMSAPFSGVPGRATAEDPVHRNLAALPRPRKHYQWYYSERAANHHMQHAPQGVHDFLRAYYHHKSADWPGNRPEPLQAWTAAELAKLPTYYVMDQDATMAETVAKEMPTRAKIDANRWLPDSELAYYAREYVRTGFQGGLQWYRCGTSGKFNGDYALYSGRTIDVPSCFISGRQDWGIYQRPGAIEAMRDRACTDMRAVHLIEGAGHWVQQERPDDVSRLLLQFLQTLS